MQYEQNVERARQVLTDYLSRTKQKVAKPDAVKIISIGMGCRTETAEGYLERMMTTESRLKTNVYQIWVE